MPEKNKILPKEKLSSRERIERKVKSFEGRPFTIRDINRLLRPRMGRETIRYHLENMVNNLYLEKFFADGQTRYIAKDLLADNKTIMAQAATEWLDSLKAAAAHLRSGKVLSAKALIHERGKLSRLIDQLEDELTQLKYLHDCTDLWHPDTLVKRIGFFDDIELSSDK